MHYKNFTLDPFQEEAINAIDKNYSVVVSAPTGSGKTLIADFIIEKHKDDPVRIIYTAPIKALSNQKYKDFSKEYCADFSRVIADNAKSGNLPSSFGRWY